MEPTVIVNKIMGLYTQKYDNQLVRVDLHYLMMMMVVVVMMMMMMILSPLTDFSFRWSRGSVLAFSTQVRGFKPDRSRRIFKGEKNPQHTFLRRGSKAIGPMS